MKLSPTIIFFFAALILSGCKSLKHLTSRDNSVRTEKTGSEKRRNIRFLKGISVRPGGLPADRNNKPDLPLSSKNKKVTYTPPPFSPTNVNIETLDPLQLKYSIILDVTVEQLMNLALLREIDQWWGTPYCYGGSTAHCIDCSAFTQIVLRDVYGVSVPRTAQEQYDYSERIGLEDLREGDLVFFNTEGHGATHVGIYLINDKFVHASTSNGVMVSDLNDTYWKPRFIGAGRVIK
jgi:hypothetical protein